MDAGGGNDSVFSGEGSDLVTGGSGFDRFIVDVLDGDTDTVFDYRDDEFDTLDFADVITRDLSLDQPVTHFISVNQNPDGSTALVIDPDGSAGPPQQVGVLIIHNGLVTPLQDLVTSGLLFYQELRTAAAHPPCRTHSGIRPLNSPASWRGDVGVEEVPVSTLG